MRVLYVVPYVPNAIRVRPYSLIRALLEYGHQVTVATVWESDDERVQLDRLRAWGAKTVAFPLTRGRKLRNLATALPSAAPLQARFCWQPALAEALRDEINRTPYDVVHIEHLRGAAYGTYLLQQVASGAVRRLPIVWDSVDCISHLFAQAATQSRSRKGRLMTRVELPRTRRHEAHLVQLFDHTVVTSAADRAALVGLWKDKAEVDDGIFGMNGAAGLSETDARPPHSPTSPLPHNPISVLPNGVDTDFFRPGETRTKRPSIVVSGKMSYHANVSMVLDLVELIMPRVWDAVPEAQLWIVGKDPPPTLTRLDPRWRADRNPPAMGASNERIVVTGFVDDIRPYLQQAWAATAPVRYGAGIQNKVLEAMACGTPVAATRPAVAALAVENGRELLIGQDAAEVAQALTALLTDAERARALGTSGAAFVEARHSWQYAAARLTEIYAAAQASRDGSSRAPNQVILVNPGGNGSTDSASR